MRVSPLLYQGPVALNASGQPVVTARNVQVLVSSLRSTAPVAGDGSAMGDWVPLALPAVVDSGEPACSENRAGCHGPDGKGKGPPGDWRHESPCDPTLLAKQGRSAASSHPDPMTVAATKHAVNRFRKQRHESR